MNWQSEVVKLIELHFKNIGINYKPAINVHRCLVDFMNLSMKLIPATPRAIYKSDKLRTRPLSPTHIKALNTIEQKIRVGADITHHQSKKVLDPTYNDLLMNEWIIQHLHLSDTKTHKNQKFYDRSKYLLFVAFNRTQAFFIDIREHDEKSIFAKRELLEIIDNNWPQLLKEHTSEEDKRFSNNYTDEDRDILRRKGYALGFTTLSNGKVIRNPGLGVTTSGHNMFVVSRANEVVRFIHESLEEIEKDEESVRQSLSDEAGFKINELDLCIHQLNKWPFFAVYENQAKCYIHKNYEKQTVTT